MRLEFKLQQTSCHKKDWKKPECTVKPNGVSERAPLMGPAAWVGTGAPRSYAHHWGCLQGRGKSLHLGGDDHLSDF